MNTLGSLQSVSRRSITKRPPTTPTISVTAIGSFGATISFTNYSALDTLYCYDVYWTYSGGSGNSLSNTSNTVNLTALPPNTALTFTAYVRYKSGGPTSAVSSSAAATTYWNATPIYTASGVTAVFNSTNYTSMTVSGATGAYSYANSGATPYSISVSSQYYQNGASSPDVNFMGLNIFNLSEGKGWYSMNGSYSGSTGNYNGSTTTVSSSQSILGEWCQIRFPFNLVLKTYKLKSNSISDFGKAKGIYLVASTNGTNWTTIAYHAYDNITSSGSYVGIEDTYTVANNNAYNYYRIIMTKTTPNPHNASSLGRLMLMGYIQ